MTSSAKKNITPEKLPFTALRDSVLIVPFALFLFLFFSSVMVVFPDLSVFDSKRVFQIGIIPILFLAAVIHPTLRVTTGGLIKQTPKSIKLALLLFFIVGIVSSLRISHPAYSLVEAGLLFSLILLIYVVAAVRIIIGRRFDQYCLVFITVLGAAVMLQETMGLLASLSIGSEFSYDSMFIYFSHPRFFNQLQTWSIPLVAALPFFFPGNRKIQIATILVLAIQWYLLLASGARGSFLSLCIAIVVVGLLSLPNGIKWLALHISGALSGLFIFFSIYLLQKLRTTGGGGQFIAESLGRNMTHSMGRNTFWTFAWNDALQNPWLGAGPGRFACNAEIPLAAHPHNMVFQLLSEWGFPATLLIVGVVMFLGWQLLKRVRLPGVSTNSDNTIIRLSLTTSLIAAAIHSGASGLLVMPASSMMAVLIGGWLLAVMSGSSSTEGRYTMPNVVIVAGLAVSLALLVFVSLELRHYEYRMTDFGKFERQMPRFWNEGRICRYTY